MTKESMNLLKRLKKFTNNSPVLLSGSTNKIYRQTDRTVMDTSDFHDDLATTLNYLFQNDYLATTKTGAFYLTHKGIHYKQLKWISIRNFLCKEFFTGFILGVATTVVANLILRFVL